MAKNMLCVNPYMDQFMGTVLDSLRRTLCSSEEVDNIEIEIKYAEFKRFGSLGIDVRYLKEMSQQMKEELMNAFEYQVFDHKRSLEMMSKQAIISLNPLGKNAYQLAAGFDEFKHRRFYHIRELLLKMCRYNSENNYTARPLRNSDEPRNIYHELSLNANNHLLRLKEENEMRLDLYIKEEAPESLRGRYSYSNRSGWKRTEKVPLCAQLDFMLNQRTFRFAINREVQTDVPAENIVAVGNILRANPKLTDIRLKRILRVDKGEICEYALSEIYSINDRNNNNFLEIPDKISGPAGELNAYLSKIFINFFSVHERNNIKFEIESEFTRNMARHFKKLLQRNNLREVQHEVEGAIEELYALFWAEHSTKVKEVPLLNSRVGEMPEARLENEFGNYMRSELYDAMRKG